MVRDDEKLNNIKLVQNIPEFELEYSKDKDKFNHKTYASTIAQVIEHNAAPLTIGLLGPWGSGKSTILNILMKNLGKNKCRFIYFNAWKYSSDSFRRQFIIECIDGLMVDKKLKEKEKLKFKRRLLSEVKTEILSIGDILKNIKRDAATFLQILLCSFILIAVVVVGIVMKNNLFAFSSILMAIIMLILTKHIPQLIQLNVPSDPQLVLPEQFEAEFARLIDKYSQSTEKLVFIVDDIDRCPSHMIMDILDAVKNFLAPSRKGQDSTIYSKCYFVVAMDDKAVVSILKEERGENYENEEVLKFFDVIIKLHPLRVGDLIDFSKGVAKETGLPVDVINIAIYGGFDTPRKIKHFLNTFSVTYYNAKLRYMDNTFPFEPQEIAEALAKILVIEISFPERFDELLLNPTLIEKWENEADILLQGLTEKRESILKDHDFLKFLWATKDIRLHDIDAMLHLKLPVWATNLQEYSFLKSLILQRDIEEIKKIAIDIKTDDRKESIVETLREMLDFVPPGIFLTNILFSGLAIYQIIDFPQKIRSIYADLLLRNMFRYRKILKFDPSLIFELTKYVRCKDEREKEIIRLGINDINQDSDASNIAKFISILYQKEDIQ
jgi:hypothetical protein